jgi:hypothetical protein
MGLVPGVVENEEEALAGERVPVGAGEVRRVVRRLRNWIALGQDLAHGGIRRERWYGRADRVGRAHEIDGDDAVREGGEAEIARDLVCHSVLDTPAHAVDGADRWRCREPRAGLQLRCSVTRPTNRWRRRCGR